MFTRIRALLAQPTASTEPCRRCSAYEAEIAWLREQHDALLDRVLATAGILQATREAMAVTDDGPDSPPEPSGPEDPEVLTEEMEEMALQEQRRFAAEAGLPVSSTYDS